MEFYRYVINDNWYEVLLSKVSRSYKSDLWGSRVPKEFFETTYELIYLGRFLIDSDNPQAYVENIVRSKLV